MIKNFIMRTQPEDEEEEEEESMEDIEGIQSLEEFFDEPGDDKSEFDFVENSEIKALESRNLDDW